MEESRKAPSVVYFCLYMFFQPGGFCVTAAIADANREGKKISVIIKECMPVTFSELDTNTCHVFPGRYSTHCRIFTTKLFCHPAPQPVITGLSLLRPWNMIISLLYYLKVVRGFMEKEWPAIACCWCPLPVKLALRYLCAGGTLLWFLSWVYDYINPVGIMLYKI